MITNRVVPGEQMYINSQYESHYQFGKRSVLNLSKKEFAVNFLSRTNGDLLTACKKIIQEVAELNQPQQSKPKPTDSYQYLRSSDPSYQAGLLVGLYNRLEEVCSLSDEEIVHIMNVIYHKFQDYAGTDGLDSGRGKTALASPYQLQNILRIRRSYSSIDKVCRAEVRRAVKELNIYPSR